MEVTWASGNDGSFRVSPTSNWTVCRECPMESEMLTHIMWAVHTLLCENHCFSIVSS